MITYVNTVLVGTGVGSLVQAVSTADPCTMTGATAGKYVVVDNDGVIITTTAAAASAEAIKVGLITSKTTVNKKTGLSMPIVKWSNIIKKDDLKSYSYTTYTADTEDVCVVTFNNDFLTNAIGKRIVVRLTFKDLPTRFRKWSESYEYVATSTSAADIVNAFVNLINVKGEKRARVVASNSSNTLVITALPYTDDDMVDSISPAAKVRFTANAWYTDPSAAGFASKNKYNVATIAKTPGTYYTASAKLVRDAEIQAMGYEGILNRGMGTWPIIKPDMNTNLSAHYDAITLEFENMYHSADDLNRKTKQTLQIFETNGHSITIANIISAFAQGEHTVNAAQGTKDTVNNK